MAFQVSPGVLVQERDLTNVIPAIATTIGAVAGQFSQGPMDQVTTISSEKELVETFGKPDSTTFEYFFSAASFLQYSSSLRVVRAANSGSVNAVVSGTALQIKNTDHYQNGDGSTGLTMMVRLTLANGLLEQRAHGVIHYKFQYVRVQRHMKKLIKQQLTILQSPLVIQH